MNHQFFASSFQGSISLSFAFPYFPYSLLPLRIICRCVPHRCAPTQSYGTLRVRLAPRKKKTKKTRRNRSHILLSATVILSVCALIGPLGASEKTPPIVSVPLGSLVRSLFPPKLSFFLAIAIPTTRRSRKVASRIASRQSYA